MTETEARELLLKAQATAASMNDTYNARGSGLDPIVTLLALRAFERALTSSLSQRVPHHLLKAEVLWSILAPMVENSCAKVAHSDSN